MNATATKPKKKKETPWRRHDCGKAKRGLTAQGKFTWETNPRSDDPDIARWKNIQRRAKELYDKGECHTRHEAETQALQEWAWTNKIDLTA